MTEDPIPGDLKDFILKHIDSISQLEALLLLRRSPGEIWDAATIAKRLYTSEPEAEEQLAHLCADGFLWCDAGVYRYSCRTPEQAQMVDRLADLYVRHLIPVTNLIHAKPRRIRQFARAFKLRKDS